MTHRPLLAAVPLAGGLLVGSLLLGGCTLDGSDEATGTAPAVPDASTASTASVEGVGGTVDALLAAAGEPSTEVTDELPVLGSREVVSADGPYAVELNGVVVRDELMTVVFTMRMSDEAEGSLTLSTLFDDGRTPDGEGAAGPSAFSSDGVYVLDAAEGTRHLTAYDSEDRCVCSDALNNRAGLTAGSSVVLSSTFAAPPGSTTVVDVVIPTAGAFTGIELER